jgi:HEAT repeat protein
MKVVLRRLTALLQIRPGELSLVGSLFTLLFVANAGIAIGTPGVDALFYSRFGVEYLPVMYVIMGVVSPATSLAMTALLVRVSAVRLFSLMPLGIGLLVLAARLLLELELSWFYPVLWLGKTIAWVLKTLFLWGLAGAVCDTRQAKRLFPLFGVGGILGMTAGSLATGPLVTLIGADDLLLAWTLGWVATFVLARRLLARHRVIGTERRLRPGKPGLLGEIKQGVDYVRTSGLLGWMALAAVLFAVMYYGLGFVFARAVAEQFPDESAMASFLGTFMGVATGAAVLASLFLANRLYARFGFMTIILAYPVIYLAGFSVSLVSAGFVVLVLFRFVQTFWATGVFEGAVQAMFNVVPSERRQPSRTFVVGIANQLGVSLAGVMLLLSDRWLPARAVYALSIAAAAATAYFVWQSRRAYGPALVAALRAGRSQVFFSDEEPFGGFQLDAAAVAAAVEGLASPDLTLRRASAEVLGALGLPETVPVVVTALKDDDPIVRAAALRALAAARPAGVSQEVAAALDDPAPEVRLKAIETLLALVGHQEPMTAQIQPMLDDADAAVRCRAAGALLQLGPHQEAAALLLATAAGEGGVGTDARLYALEALAALGGQQAYAVAARSLSDGKAAVRQAAARLIGRIDPGRCLDHLTLALADEDAAVREAAARALGEIGPPALEKAVAALSDPSSEDGALLALRYLPAHEAASAVLNYARDQLQRGLHYHGLWQRQRGYQLWRRQSGQDTRSATPDLPARSRLLADALQSRARRHASNALRAMASQGETESLLLAVENLSSGLDGQRANAIETLDALGQRGIVRPLLPIWEPPEPDPGDDIGWLDEVLQDGDAWTRAAGALAAGPLADGRLGWRLESLAQSDPDELVRESARLSLNGVRTMETIQTLSVMERVLFLRQVPLLAGLLADDLVRIASVAGEAFFVDGAVMARQGEVGDALYIIVSGEVTVSARTNDGDEHELARRGVGEYVGEMAIISDELRMATLTARGDVRALTISQAAFRDILRMRPEVSLAIMNTLCQRLREQA